MNLTQQQNRIMRLKLRDFLSPKEKIAILKQRIWEEDNSGCWVWLGATNTDERRPTVKINGKRYFAHRVIYEWHFNTKLGSLLACHKCDNVACVNPNHIFPGTNRDNLMDMMKKKRSLCHTDPVRFARNSVVSNAKRKGWGKSGVKHLFFYRGGYLVRSMKGRRVVFRKWFKDFEEAKKCAAVIANQKRVEAGII